MRTLLCAGLAVILAGCAEDSAPAQQQTHVHETKRAVAEPVKELPTTVRAEPSQGDSVSYNGKTYSVRDKSISYYEREAYVTATVEGDGVKQATCRVSAYRTEVLIQGTREWEVFDKWIVEERAGWICQSPGRDGKVDSFRIGNKTYPVEGYGSNLALEQKAQELHDRYTTLLDITTVRKEIAKREKQHLDELLRD